MLFNATLLRVDDPPDEGPAVAVRCSMGSPTAGELDVIGALGLEVSAVLYLPAASAALTGPPAVGQHVRAQLDGRPPRTYPVLHATERIGAVLSHVQLFLGDAGEE